MNSREEFLAAEVLRLQEEISVLRANNVLLRDLLRGTNLVLVGADTLDGAEFGTKVHRWR